jgi:hypothetical protein
VGKIPAKFISQSFSTSGAMTSHKLKHSKPKWQRSFTNAAECKSEFVHTELVQVFYDIKWISSGYFELEKKPTNNP